MNRFEITTEYREHENFSYDFEVAIHGMKGFIPKDTFPDSDEWRELYKSDTEKYGFIHHLFKLYEVLSHTIQWRDDDTICFYLN